MKRHLPTIAGALLGLLFVTVGLMVILELGPTPPPPPEGSKAALFFGAFGSSGYITFVKVFEVLGGVLVAFPRTRNLGLLVLGPIILNILAFHVFITDGADLFSPMVVLVCLLAAFLLWVERRAFAGLVHRRCSAPSEA